MANINPKSKGFTLVELVVVIVVLGVMSATVTTKYLDISQDAKSANLEAVGGAMRSGLQLIKLKAIVEGEDSSTGNIRIAGVDIPLYNGAPAVRGKDSFKQINQQVLAWLDIDAVDRNTAKNNREAATFFTDKSTKNNHIYIFFSEDYDQKSVNFKCHIRYENPETSTPIDPVVTIETSQC